MYKHMGEHVLVNRIMVRIFILSLAEVMYECNSFVFKKVHVYVYGKKP